MAAPIAAATSLVGLRRRRRDDPTGGTLAVADWYFTISNQTWGAERATLLEPSSNRRRDMK